MEWDVRQIGFYERGPIARFTLDLMEKHGTPWSLDELDRMDLIALVGREGDEEALHGLTWLRMNAAGNRALVAFCWMETSIPLEPRQRFVQAMEEWASDRGAQVLVGYTRLPYQQVKKWAEKYEFEITEKREVVRPVRRHRGGEDGG